MIPGNPLILKCPHCGTRKEVVSLVSGNTFGATMWSDQRMFAPMLPKVSIVQRCPNCGHYFFSYKQEKEEYSNGFTLSIGYVDYPHLKKAMGEFFTDKVEKNDELNLRFLMVHAYNDWFYRSVKDNGKPTEVDTQFFNNNISKLMEIFPWKSKEQLYFKAELFRESSQFDEAIKTLPVKTVENKNMHEFIVEEKKHIDKRSTRPFVVWGKEQKLTLKMD